MSNVENQLIKNGIRNVSELCRKFWTVPLWRNGPIGEQYFKGLSRRDQNGNPVGSYMESIETTHQAFEFLESLSWKEWPPDDRVKKEGCTYLRAYSTKEDGILAAVTLNEAVGFDNYEIHICEGNHGTELIAEIPFNNTPVIKDSVWSLQRTSVITAIIEDGMLTTWHPGNPLLPFDGKVLTDHTAVKIILKE